MTTTRKAGHLHLLRAALLVFFFFRVTLITLGFQDSIRPLFATSVRFNSEISYLDHEVRSVRSYPVE